MANMYVCAHCGWEESVHLFGGRGFSEERRADMNVLRPGYIETQMQCGAQYEPPSQEVLAQEAERRSDGAYKEGSCKSFRCL